MIADKSVLRPDLVLFQNPKEVFSFQGTHKNQLNF